MSRFSLVGKKSEEQNYLLGFQCMHVVGGSSVPRINWSCIYVIAEFCITFACLQTEIINEKKQNKQVFKSLEVRFMFVAVYTCILCDKSVSMRNRCQCFQVQLSIVELCCSVKEYWRMYLYLLLSGMFDESVDFQIDQKVKDVIVSWIVYSAAKYCHTFISAVKDVSFKPGLCVIWFKNKEIWSYML